MLFEPFTINGVTFKNRILRSSIGGKTSFYDGTVGPAWSHFELRFAERGVAALISATISVHDRRWSPLQYPKISDDRFIAPIREGVQAVQAHDCRYILQLGDPGSHTQMSLLPEAVDQLGPSGGFDLIFGYGNRIGAMRRTTFSRSWRTLRRGRAGPARPAATASRSPPPRVTCIQQFLNPATNRRRDGYGGSVEKRCALLREVVGAVRARRRRRLPPRGAALGRGPQLPAGEPAPAAGVPAAPLVHGQRPRRRTLTVARELSGLGVDYLHITSGFGFINPKESPGEWPVDEVRRLSPTPAVTSASRRSLRATLVNG